MAAGYHQWTLIVCVVPLIKKQFTNSCGAVIEAARDPCENVMVARLWIRCQHGGLQLLEGRGRRRRGVLNTAGECAEWIVSICPVCMLFTIITLHYWSEASKVWYHVRKETFWSVQNRKSDAENHNHIILPYVCTVEYTVLFGKVRPYTTFYIFTLIKCVKFIKLQSKSCKFK